MHIIKFSCEVFLFNFFLSTFSKRGDLPRMRRQALLTQILFNGYREERQTIVEFLIRIHNGISTCLLMWKIWKYTRARVRGMEMIFTLICAMYVYLLCVWWLRHTHTHSLTQTHTFKWLFLLGKCDTAFDSCEHSVHYIIIIKETFSIIISSYQQLN